MTSPTPHPSKKRSYDVVVIGGGPAGLSAATTLSRSRRSVLVIDGGQPRNAPAEGAHNYLGREGIAPLELLALGRAEVASYGGEVIEGQAISAKRIDSGHFQTTLVDGSTVDSRRLLVTTGLVDELPQIPGLAERWGRDVLHCPYCHGWEVRDQKIGILASSPLAMHHTLMFRQLSDRITLFLNNTFTPNEEEREQLAARNISVVEGEVTALEITSDKLSGVRLNSGEIVACEALTIAPRFTARVDVLASLGLTAVEQKMGELVVGSFIPADAHGATAEPGVWVAGNVTDLFAQVISSAAAGVNAGAIINADLITEDTQKAVTEYRKGALLK